MYSMKISWDHEQCNNFLFHLAPFEETGESEEGNNGKARFWQLNKLVKGDGIIFWCRGWDFDEDRCEKRNNDGEEDEGHVGYESANE